MKCSLTLLRHDGKRLPADQLVQSTRLITVTLSVVQGFRQATARCCYGGIEIAQLWEPVLIQIGRDDLTFHGFERLGDAAMVQEWRLRPYFVALSDGKRA